MIRGAWIRGRALLALALAACGGDSSGPDSGALAVSVTGLPGGTPANVSVVGPGGFSQAIVGAATLTDLAPGSYTVTGSPVSAGAEVYTANPASQTVTVSGGGTATSTVTYGPSSGTLTVNISGLPIGVSAAVDISGPSGYAGLLTAGATLTGLLPGQYTLTAQPVANGSTQYVGTPATQDAAVSSGVTATASVAYSESTGSGVNLRIDGLYLTQSVQTYDRAVPLVADRDAFLRVFVTSTAANVPSPTVRVRLYNGGVLTSDQSLTRVGATPLAPQEGTLGSSWNVAVPKALVTPNLSIMVDVDPDNLVAETNETDNTFPASGTPLAAPGGDGVDLPGHPGAGDDQRGRPHRQRHRRKQEPVPGRDDADAPALGVRRVGRRPAHGGRHASPRSSPTTATTPGTPSSARCRPGGSATAARGTTSAW